MSIVAEAYGGRHPMGYVQVHIRSMNEQTNMRETTNGLVVIEFGYEEVPRSKRLSSFVIFFLRMNETAF